MSKPNEYMDFSSFANTPVFDFISLLEKQKIDWSQWTPDKFILEYAKFKEIQPEQQPTPIPGLPQPNTVSQEPIKYNMPITKKNILGMALGNIIPLGEFQKLAIMPPKEVIEDIKQFGPPPSEPSSIEKMTSGIEAGVSEFVNTQLFGLPRLAGKILGVGKELEEIRNLPEYQTNFTQVARGLGHLGGLIGPSFIAKAGLSPLAVGGKLGSKITSAIFRSPQGAATPALSFLRFILDNGLSLGIAESLASWEGDTAKEIFKNKAQAYIHGQVLGSLTSPANFITFAKSYPVLAFLTRFGIGSALYDIITGQRPWDERPLLQKVVDYGLQAWINRRGFGFKEYHALTQELNRLHEEAKANNIPTAILPTTDKTLENLEKQPIPEQLPETMSNKQLKEKFMQEQQPVFRRAINYEQDTEQVKQELEKALNEAPTKEIKIQVIAEGKADKNGKKSEKIYYPNRIPQPGELLYGNKIKEVHIISPEAFMYISSPRPTEEPERRVLNEEVVRTNKYTKEVEPPSPPWLKPAKEIPVPKYLRRKIDAIAETVAKHIQDNQGGGTYSIAFGEITPDKLSPYRTRTPEGQEGETYIASAWAGRTFEIAKEKITKEVIKDYLYSNMDILSDFSRVFGFYVDNGKIIFDISTMTPDLAKLQRISKTQQAAWKLFAKQTEDLGGEGYTNAITEMELGPPRTRDWDAGGEPLTIYAVSPIAPHSSKKAELNPTFFGSVSFEGDNARLIERSGQKIDLKEGAAPKLGFWTPETSEINHDAFTPLEVIENRIRQELSSKYKNKKELDKAVNSQMKKEKNKTYYLYKAQIDKASLLEINPQNPPDNPALAAAAAGKKGWYDPVSKEVHLIAPIESEAIGAIRKKPKEGEKVSGQNIESFTGPMSPQIIDFANYNDDDTVIFYDNPEAFGLKKKVLRVIQEIEDLPQKLKIPLPFRLTKGEKSATLATRIASENPYYILDYYPEIKANSYDLARERVWVEYQHLEKLRQSITKWKKELKQTGHNFKESGQKILAYAIAQQEGGLALLEKLGLKVKELSPTELKIYNEMRQGFDEMYPLINEARKLYGKEPMGYVKEYFTFMRNFTENPDISLDVLFKYDSDYLHRILTEPGFPYAQERKVSEKPLVLNAFDVYLKYMEKAASYVATAPLAVSTELLLQPHVINENGQLKTISLERTAPQLYNYLKSWRQYILRYDVPSFLNQFPHLNKLLQRVNKNIALALLSYNLRTFLIQPAALRNSIIELNPYWVLKGIVKGIFQDGYTFARDNSHVLKPRVFEIFINQFYEAPKGSRLRQYLDRIGEFGVLALKTMDGMAAAMTWLGAYEKATKAMGMTHEQAVKWADDITIYTQASGHRHDLPIIQRENSMRFLLTMFQTFGINEWNYLGERVFGKGPLNLSPQERFKRIFWLLTSTAAANAIFEDFLKVRSPFPAPEKAIKMALEEEKPLPEVVGAALREMAEEVPIIGGAIRWSTAYRSFMPAGMQIFQDIIRLTHKLTSGENPLKILKPEDYAALCKLLGIPGVGETEKVVRRLKKGLPLLPALLGQRTDILDVEDENGYIKRLQEFFKKFDIDGFVLNLQKQKEEQ